jgi:hypothetical protein
MKRISRSVVLMSPLDAGDCLIVKMEAKSAHVPIAAL